MSAPNEPTNPSNLFTPFLPTTNNIPEEDDRLRVFLYDRFANFADCINDKKIGIYRQDSNTFNGEAWIYDTTKKIRNGYQVIARIPSFITEVIPLPIPLVNPQFVITLAYGSANKPCSAIGAGDGSYFSFMSKGDTRITFDLTDTTISIVATAPMAAFSGYIVIEFLLDGS